MFRESDNITTLPSSVASGESSESNATERIVDLVAAESAEELRRQWHEGLGRIISDEELVQYAEELLDELCH